MEEIGNRRPGMPIAITLAPEGAGESTGGVAELPRIDTSGAVASSASGDVPENPPQDVPAPSANAVP